MAAPVILVEATPRRPSDGAPVTVRLAGGGASAPYFYGNEHWRAGLTALPKSVAALDFDGEQLGGGGVAQAIELGWASPSTAALAELSALYWTDAPIVVRVGPEGDALPPVVTSGLVLETASDKGVLKIALADQIADLKRPLLVDRFAGTGGIEGPAEFAGTVKSRAWGRCFNVPGRQIDAANQIWCFGDPHRRWDAIVQVRDKGVAAAADALTVLPPAETAEATFAALQAAKAPEGGAVLCPSIACVKWWTEPAGDLRADIRGEVAGGYVETAPEIAARIVAARSAIPFADRTIAAAVAARPAPFGWRVDNDGATAAAEISALLAGVSLSWPMIDGAIRFRAWDWTAPVRVGRSVSASRKSTVKPTASRKLGYRRNWSPMARGDLAAIVLARDVLYEDGSALTDAVDKAGKTADWDKVGGTGKPADNATNSRDPNSPFGDSTVGRIKLDLYDMKARIDTLQADIEAAFSPVTATLKQDLRDLQTRLETAQGLLREAIDAVRTDVAKIEIGDPDGSIAALKDMVAALRTDTDAIAGRFETIDTRLGQFDARIAKTTTAASDAASAAASVRSELTTATGTVNSRITNEVASLSGVDRTLSDRISGMSGAFGQVYGEISNQAALSIRRDSALTESIDRQGSTLGGLKADISGVQRTLIDQDRAIATLNSAISAVASPNLITNGAFKDGYSGWRSAGDNNPQWSIYPGSPVFLQAYLYANANSVLYWECTTIEAGKPYCLSYEGEHDRGCTGRWFIEWWSGNGNGAFQDYRGRTPDTDNRNSGWGNRNNHGPWIAAPGATAARIRFYPGDGDGTRRVTRIMFQQSSVPSAAYADSVSLDALGRAVASVQSKVENQQSAIATVKGRTEAFWRQTATANDGRAEIALYASDSNGNPTGRVAITGDLQINGNAVVNGSLSVLKAGYGMTGEASIYSYQGYNDNNQTSWTGLAGVGIDVQQGAPIMGQFSFVARNLNGSAGGAYLRVCRVHPDNHVVWGGNDGELLELSARGETISGIFMDSVQAGRTVQYDVQIRCFGEANIRSTMRVVVIRELVRDHFSQIWISAPAGEGPGAGSVGGGQINGDTGSGGRGVAGTIPTGSNAGYGGLRGRTEQYRLQ